MRVLIIDDYMDYAKPLRDLFALEGHEAIYCLSGTNAVQVALEFRPQWLIIDVRIPYKSGVKVYTDLNRQANFEFSAVFYTNYYTDQELKDVLKTIEQTEIVIIPKSTDLPGDVVDKLIPALKAGYLKGGKRDGN